ncbi:MAG: hypothetical protein E7385_05630 [Ruminococcaceae bacterium]|nr:hypothetical protein [Oscillospiraceae bacterium]
MTRKLLAMLIACIMIISLFSINAFASDEGTSEADKAGGYFFFADAEYDTHYKSGNTLDYAETIDEGVAIGVKAGKTDVKCTFTFSDYDTTVYGTDLVKYPILVARIKISRELTDSDTGSPAFLISDSTQTLKDKTFSFTLENTTEWQTIVLDLAAMQADKFSGAESLPFYKLRFDPLNKSVDGELEYIIQYIAFFENTEVIADFDGDLEKFLGLAPVATEEPTEAPTEAPTEEPTEAPATEVPSTEAPKKDDKGGCGSSSAIAQVMLVLGAALIIKKKK